MTSKQQNFVTSFDGLPFIPVLLRSAAYFVGLGIYTTGLTAVALMQLRLIASAEAAGIIASLVTIPAALAGLLMYSSQHILRSRGLTWRYRELAVGYALFVIVVTSMASLLVTRPISTSITGILVALMVGMLPHVAFSLVQTARNTRRNTLGPLIAAMMLLFSPSTQAGRTLDRAAALPLAAVRTDLKRDC
ncbi:hypothetical protein ACFOPQ_01210 [Deinococcus antarcticus]|uniref:MFS transporter n=1 Tax=Deinococcus antarcticus TaxID=1298767 RepID=A0ABV8A175_9DEIO